MLGITDTQNYTDIANAIRAKNGSAATYMPSEMAAAILAIPGGGGGPRLPVEYQEVEWVGSSGTQRIETGLYNDTASIPIQYEIKGVNFDSVSSRQEAVGSQGQYYIGVNNNKWQTALGTSYTSGLTVNADTWYEVNILMSGVSATAGNARFIEKTSDTDFDIWRSTSSGANAVGFTINATYQVCLFSLNAQTLPAACKLKEVIIYQNNVKVRDLVPCYRIADTEIGFYDLVNNQFYTNAGTGTFTKGGNV